MLKSVPTSINGDASSKSQQLKDAIEVGRTLRNLGETVALAELASIKRWIAIHLRKYCLAIMYRRSLGNYPKNVSFSATCDLHLFEEDKAFLITQASEAVKSLGEADNESLLFSSNGSTVMTSEWKTLLQSEYKLDFEIPYNHFQCY